MDRVTRDFEAFQFNTVVSALMELLNEVSKAAQAGAASDPAAAAVWEETRSIYLRLMAPVVPHVAEELWHRLGYDGSVHVQPWPAVDAEAAAEDEITLVVQVNGKVRDRLTVPADVSRETAEQLALASDGGRRFTAGLTVRKVVYVPGRLVNIVAS